MKLRLQITTDSGTSRSFEHAGPVVCIGRDPECELALEGDASQSVSRQHARIELSKDGATLTDAGSSNGTLLNDRPIDKPESLRAGDRIQLGYTGATLTVVELDLTPTPPPVRQLSRRTIGIGASIAAACLLGLGAALLLRRSETAPPVPSQDNKTMAGVDNEPKPPSKPPPPPPPPPQDVPNVEAREIGRHVAQPQWGPSVLLQRQGEAYPWTTLRSESRVATACTLLSLPGYRSVIALDSGVQVTLWGNLPEFSGFPPVLESVVMLNVPATGIDADLTLDHGRVLLTNRKLAGPARVRLRFLRETWDLTLPDPGSEVCAEIWNQPEPATKRGGVPAVCLGLFTKGKVRLQTPTRQLDLGDRSRLSWVGPDGALVGPATLPQLPDWWIKPPDRANPLVADAMLTLLDWSKVLAKSSEVVDAILTRVRESADATERAIGLLFLTSLDGVPYLVDFLEDRQSAPLRGTAAHALRAWLARGGDQPAELARILQERRGYTKEKSALIVELLQYLPPDSLFQKETYTRLIGYLDHENLAVRDLAHWHLESVARDEARKIAYEPTAEAEQRRKTIGQWQMLLQNGKLPPRRPASQNAKGK